MKQNKKIELRSEKVRNIIGQIPSIYLRYGIAIIFFSLLTIVGIAAFIPYRQSVEIVINISKDISGEISFCANIPSNVIEKKNQFKRVRADFLSKYRLPTLFLIESFSETVHLSDDNAWYIAYLSPLNPISSNISIEKPITIPAQIELKETSLLRWVVENVAGLD
jgi:hypothetical protein